MENFIKSENLEDLEFVPFEFRDKGGLKWITKRSPEETLKILEA
jgi:hypothetical protein